MKLVVSKQELLDKIQITQPAVSSSNTTLPVLSHILIDATESPPKLVATDLELGISTKLQGEVIESGALTVPARKLTEIVKELPNIDLTLLGKKNNTITIESERMVFRLSGFPKEEFPKIPQITNGVVVSIEASILREILGRVVFAISQDETRYVLNGALFVLEPKQLTIVSTDGRRLAVCVTPTTISVPQTRQFIVPAKMVHEVVRSLGERSGEAILRFSETQVVFVNGETTIGTAWTPASERTETWGVGSWCGDPPCRSTPRSCHAARARLRPWPRPRDK
jgi:DNA polymerase-3 subunit beta